MQERHLKQVHLSRLSPVMWGWPQGYPRGEWGVPIKPAYGGMGSTEGDNYESATPINPKGAPVWSETWQQRAAGALKRVPISGCGCGVGDDPETGEDGKLSLGAGMAIGAVISAVLIFGHMKLFPH